MAAAESSVVAMAELFAGDTDERECGLEPVVEPSSSFNTAVPAPEAPASPA